MKPEYIFTIFATAQGIVLTQVFSPNILGLWSDSFFLIPYTLAFYLVPMSSGALAYVFAKRWYSKHEFTSTILSAGVAISIPAFFLYGLVHSLTVGSIVGAHAIAPAYFAFTIFGSILFLPISIIMGIAAAYTIKINSSNKQLKKDQ